MGGRKVVARTGMPVGRVISRKREVGGPGSLPMGRMPLRRLIRVPVGGRQGGCETPFENAYSGW